VLAVAPSAAHAAGSLALVDQTEPLGPGITLRHVNALDQGGWYDSQILTVDLANPAVGSDLLMAGKVAEGGPLSVAANQAGAVAGVNGEFFDIGNSTAPQGGEVRSGVLIKSPDAGGRGHIGVGKDGIARIVDLTVEASATLNGTPTTIASINASNVAHGLPKDSMIAFTNAWGTSPRARGLQGATDVAEVLVRNGVVVSVNPNGTGADDIPADGFVLDGRESAATAIRALKVGDPVTLSYGLKDAVAQQMQSRSARAARSSPTARRARTSAPTSPRAPRWASRPTAASSSSSPGTARAAPARAASASPRRPTTWPASVPRPRSTSTAAAPRRWSPARWATPA
jgi:hypothetical protein